MYFSIYKLNADKAKAEYQAEHKADYNEEYTPTNDGRCYMDEIATIWLMEDDWYCMLKVPEYDTELIEYYLKDAYSTIGEEYTIGKAKLVFENAEVI